MGQCGIAQPGGIAVRNAVRGERGAPGSGAAAVSGDRPMPGARRVPCPGRFEGVPHRGSGGRSSARGGPWPARPRCHRDMPVGRGRPLGPGPARQGHGPFARKHRSAPVKEGSGAVAALRPDRAPGGRPSIPSRTPERSRRHSRPVPDGSYAAVNTLTRRLSCPGARTETGQGFGVRRGTGGRTGAAHGVPHGSRSRSPGVAPPSRVHPSRPSSATSSRSVVAESP